MELLKANESYDEDNEDFASAQGSAREVGKRAPPKAPHPPSRAGALHRDGSLRDFPRIVIGLYRNSR